jgi:hypothetical protein
MASLRLVRTMRDGKLNYGKPQQDACLRHPRAMAQRPSRPFSRPGEHAGGEDKAGSPDLPFPSIAKKHATMPPTLGAKWRTTGFLARYGNVMIRLRSNLISLPVCTAEWRHS